MPFAWSAKARLGSDTIYSEEMFKIGKRLTTKLFNVAKFVHLQLHDENSEASHVINFKNISVEIDRLWMAKLNQLINTCTRHFEAYDYAGALSETETLFWEFCDFYIELVKARAYQDGNLPTGQSALSTLGLSLEVFLKQFAPITPYICEELWHWSDNKKSIHLSFASGISIGNCR